MILLCLVVLIIFSASIAQADTIEQDSLRVRFEIENIEYSNNVKGVVRVSNIGIRPIEDITIESLFPDEIKNAKDSTNISEIGTLEAGQSNVYEFYMEQVSSLSQPDANDSSNQSSNDSKELDNPTTGHNEKTIWFIIIACISIALLIIISLKMKKGKKVLSLLLCLVYITTLFGNSINVHATESDSKKVLVEESFIINGELYNIQLLVNYKQKSNTVMPSGSIISRGRWISLLIDAMEYSSEQRLEIDDLDTVFTDIVDHEYEDEIIRSVIHSIVDTEEETFRPDEPATRQFAAVTAVKALNFSEIQDIICDDSDEIEHKKAVEVAVFMDIIKLENNRFYPMRSLTQSEAEYILEGVRGILKCTEVDADYDSVIKLKEGVIELSDNITYEVNESRFIFLLDDETKSLKKDDIFVLPDLTPYKVSKVTQEGNSLVVDTKEPEIEETNRLHRRTRYWIV